VLTQLDGQAAERRALLDPSSAPDEILPWLADFVGLVLDERWPIERRRALVAEAVTLFRFRGTMPGLVRFLEICLGVRPTIVEAFRLRGLGGAVLGQSDLPAASAPIVGGGFRVGGADAGPNELPGPATVTADAFATTAHRFTVIIPAAISPEHLAATAHLLDVHRPAHTLYELCTVGAGIRVGIGIHLGLSTIVGRTGGFDQLQLGASTIGTTGIVGRPRLGTRPAASTLGHDSRVG
jgi:phage tail-like protein